MDTRLCIELEKIRQEDSNRYESILKIYNFIYKTIKEDYFDRLIDYYNTKNEIYTNGKHISYSRYSELESKLRTQKDLLFKEFIEDATGINNTFLDMFTSSDKRFVDYFLEKTKVPIDLIERNVLTVKSYYVYNIYTMMVAYEEYKDDFDTYKSIVDMVAPVFAKIDPSYESEAVKTFETRIRKNDIDKRNLIRRLLKTESFKVNKDLQNFLTTLLTDFKFSYQDSYIEQLNNMFNVLISLESDVHKFNKLGQIIDKKNIDTIVEDLTLYLHNDLLPGVIPFYDKILLFGERQHKLRQGIETIDIPIREDVLNYLRDLNIYMFENSEESRDIFCECLDKIFDSDTYSELYEKLKILNQASKLYTSKEETEAKRLLDSLLLDDEKYKQRFNGITLTYSNSSINQIKKPRTIGERTSNLYRIHDLLPLDENKNIELSDKSILEKVVGILDNNIRDYDMAKNSPPIYEPVDDKKDVPVKKKSRFSIFDKR